MRLALVLSLSVLARDVAALAVGGPARPVARPAVARSAAATMGLVRQVNTAEFEEEIQDCSTPIVVDIFAVWCGPCQLMAPQLELVAEQYGDKVRVLKIDSDEEPDVANTLQVRGLPTILFINDMTVVARAEGALMATELNPLIEHHFFGGPKPVISDLDSVAMK